MKPGLILKNDSLVAMCSLKPKTLAEIKSIQGVKPKTLDYHGRQILKVVQEGIRKHAETPVRHRMDHKTAGRLREGLFGLLNSRVQGVATTAGISPFLLAPRHELFDISAVSKEALIRIKEMPESHLSVYQPYTTHTLVSVIRAFANIIK